MPEPAAKVRLALALGATFLLVAAFFDPTKMHPDWQGWIFLAGFSAAIFGTLYGAFYLIDDHFKRQESDDGR